MTGNIYLTFFEDGHYAFGRHSTSDPDCPAASVQFGTYAWTASTGAIKITPVIDTTDGCGLQDADKLASNGEGGFTATFPEGSVTLTPVSNSSGSIIGSFHIDDGSGGDGTSVGSKADISSSGAFVQVVTFIDGSHYFNVNFDGDGIGLEDGCYSVSGGNKYTFTTACTAAGGLSGIDADGTNEGPSNAGVVTLTLSGDSFSYSTPDGYSDTAQRLPYVTSP